MEEEGRNKARKRKQGRLFQKKEERVNLNYEERQDENTGGEKWGPGRLGDREIEKSKNDEKGRTGESRRT